MVKRCICEICTCGRHRCPHRPTNIIGRGDQPCTLSEYTNTYKQHPIPLRESFKPSQEPIKGGLFEDKTTQRSDYIRHPLERPFVHQGEAYRKPEGEMDTTTSYKKDYTEKYASPAQAIRHDAAHQSTGRFEGEPTYKADYKKWDFSGRPEAYGSKGAWAPPQAPFEGQTTMAHDFKRHQQAMRQSFKPNEGVKQSDTPFEDRTGYRDAYIKHAIPSKYIHEREKYKPSDAPFDSETTFKRDYRGQFGEKTVSFKPDNTAFQSAAPLEDGTTNRIDYRKWPMERPFVHAPEQYKKPDGEMDLNTTHQTTYREMPIDRVVAKKPESAKVSNAPFDGTTNYTQDYKKWGMGDRAKIPNKAEYHPNMAPFEGKSTYKGHYVPHEMQRSLGFRPDNRAFMSDARFEDATMYRTDYTPKPMDRCEAENIEHSMRYKFTELDARGHKLYAPVQTTITELPGRNSPLRSPTGRLQPLSVA